MATAEAPNAIKSDHFDPDNDVVLRDSPPPTIRKPKLQPTPSPPIEGVASEISTPPGSPGSPKTQKRQPKPVPNPGDALLIHFLGGGKAPQEAERAGHELIRSASDDEEMNINDGSKGIEMPVERLAQSTDLEALAAGALRAFNAGEVPPTKLDRPAEVEGPLDDHRHISPKISSINGNHELAPIQATSPKAEKSANVTLPSISSQLGDLTHLAEAATAAVDTVPTNGVHRPSISSQSPPQPPLFRVSDQVHHQQTGHGHTSPPPISPHDNFRNVPSPGLPTGPFYYPNSNPRRPSQVSDGLPYSSASDYASNVAETPGTDLSGSTPNGIPAGLDRMSIDGITNPVVGGFQCRYPGCSAQPFQTQYLLNSHANVHSQNRPHYCPVKGCQRSEGGKGFKRKNEMIRHGLVHESPGYVCPYCLDREHKYPRPDNLQRCVISRNVMFIYSNLLTISQTRSCPPRG
jgi:hypothetical protein